MFLRKYISWSEQFMHGVEGIFSSLRGFIQFPTALVSVWAWSDINFSSAALSSGMHTSISEILKEKSLKPSRRSLPCLAQSQTHPINLNHFLSVPLSPEPKPEVEGLSQSISTSCSLLPPQTGQSADSNSQTFSTPISGWAASVIREQLHHWSC